jgi:hypothetical protein
LENRLPTWDRLQKKRFEAPSICLACMEHSESENHIFRQCHYALEVWSFVKGSVAGLKELEDTQLEEAQEDWYMEYKDREDIMALLIFTYALYGYTGMQESSRMTLFLPYLCIVN